MLSPLRLFIAMWSAVFFIRMLPPLVFPTISSGTLIFMVFSLISCGIGLFLGWNLPARKRQLRPLRYNSGSVTRSYYFFWILAILSLMLGFLNLTQTGLSALWSIEYATELRLQEGRDDSGAIGDGILSILSTILSGATVYLGCFAYYFKHYLSAAKIKTAYVIFSLGIAFSFAGGGRFTSVITLLVLAFVVYQCNYVLYKRKLNIFRLLKRFLTKRVIILLVGLSWIFSEIFVVRILQGNVNFAYIEAYISGGALGATYIGAFWLDLMSNYDALTSIIFLVSIFQYYIVHSLDQLAVLMSASYPYDAPYMMAYQLYPLVALLNKFGFNIIGIQQILDQIPNAGVYFSLFGAFYLDFGYFGSFIAGFLFSFLGSLFAVNSIQSPTFLKIFASAMFWVTLIFSPIVSMLGTAIFPSLLFLLPIYVFFQPKKLRESRE